VVEVGRWGAAGVRQVGGRCVHSHGPGRCSNAPGRMHCIHCKPVRPVQIYMELIQDLLNPTSENLVSALYSRCHYFACCWPCCLAIPPPLSMAQTPSLAPHSSELPHHAPIPAAVSTRAGCLRCVTPRSSCPLNPQTLMCSQTIREDAVASSSVYVAGLQEVPVKSLEECLHYLAAGERNRCAAWVGCHAACLHCLAAGECNRRRAAWLGCDAACLHCLTARG